MTITTLVGNGWMADDSAGAASAAATAVHRDLPLCVDLDGTLVKSDMLADGLVSLLLSPKVFSILPTLMTLDRAKIKQKVAALSSFDPATLPYNEDWLAYLRAEHAKGRKLVLATAADISVARAIADHLGVFDEVIASDGTRNLKGDAKTAALVERFGRQGFVYAGNDRVDLPVWKAAKARVVVNAPAGISKRVHALGAVEAEFNNRRPMWRSMLRALRPHQWLKNVLVFVPIIAAQAVTEPTAWLGALTIFLAFCATASSTYIINDLADLQADRQHPRKRRRPFASADLPVALGLGMAGVLFVTGLVLAASVGALPIIILYTIVSTTYSLAIKEQPLIDVFTLAGLYTLRVLAGGIASGHTVSLWLLAFSGFLFLSLALIKRTAEIRAVAASGGEQKVARRGYWPEDQPILMMLGTSSAFASSVVLSLFVSSSKAQDNYAAPEFLWGVVPLILFWQCRLWLSTTRGHMHDDPIVYTARDWVSWIVGAGVMVLILCAATGFVRFA